MERVGQLSRVVVGRVLAVQRHPNADRLHLVDVDVGGEKLSVVCGANNVLEDALVAVARVGAELSGGITVRKARIRGVYSPGMICSEKELALGDDHEGIMILPSGLAVGEELQQALGLEDVVFDIEITANRGDCLSTVGVAREVAALTGSRLRLPEMSIRKGEEPETRAGVPVRIESPDLCPFYGLRLIEDIEVAPSPLWLKRSIILSGGKPVNNVVDVTNYVMWELGQPLHAFDLARVSGPEIIVRRARAGEVIVTLDGKKRELTSQILVIADTKEAIALAGVMGGKDSEVADSTSGLILEAAFFDAVNTGRTARTLGLASEASARFERGVDPAMLQVALHRASVLIQEVAGGRIMEPPGEAGRLPLEKTVVSFRPERVQRLTGSPITEKACKDALTGLGFVLTELTDEAGPWRVKVPTFRRDVTREIDLVEEVCRLYGYDNIGVSLPGLGRRGGGDEKEELFADNLKDCLVGCGFYEAKTHSLTSEESASLQLEAPMEPITIRNPLAAQQCCLRPYLFFQLLEAAGSNYHLGMSVVRLMEIGRVFARDASSEGMLERSSLCAVAIDESLGFYGMKGFLELVLEEAGAGDVEYVPASLSYLSIGRQAEIQIGGARLGVIGIASSSLCSQLKIPAFSHVFELDLDALFSASADIQQYKPLPRFPAVKRDISIVVGNDVSAADIQGCILNGSPLVETVEFFDLYQGEGIPAGSRALALSVSFRHPERTLTDEEVNKVRDCLVASLQDKWNVVLRER